MKEINIRELVKLVNDGNTDREISKITGFSIDTVWRNRKKLGLKSNTLKERELNIFNDKYLMSVLIGTLLGDAWLTKSSKNSYRGGISHCKKQLGYLEYKHNILKKISNDIYNKKIDHIKIFNKDVYNKESNFFRFKASTYLKKLYDLLYTSKGKTITEELLNYFTEDTIAFLYFDDGNMVKEKNNNFYSYKIATYGLDNTSIELLRKYLLTKLNIETTIRSDNTLYIKAKSREIFKKILLKHNIECMKYKILN